MKIKFKSMAILIALIVFTSCLFVGCDFKKEDEKDKKYDVAIKVRCSDGKEWIFQPGVNELTYEYDHDGVKRAFSIEVCLVDHPRHHDVWFTPSSTGANVLTVSLAKFKDGHAEKTDCVFDKGEYSLFIYAEGSSKLWYPRSACLLIIVK